jgi:hypothetical protein
MMCRQVQAVWPGQKDASSSWPAYTFGNLHLAIAHVRNAYSRRARLGRVWLDRARASLRRARRAIGSGRIPASRTRSKPESGISDAASAIHELA